jgi:hypothetical protein
MLRHCILLVALFFAMSIQNTSAQTADEEALVQLIQKRQELINIAKSTPRIPELVNLHTPDFVSVTTAYLPDGTSTRKERDLTNWKEVLSNYANAGDLEYHTKLENIAFSQVFEKSAVVIYRSSYVMKDVWDKSELYGGDQIITANFRKTPDGWKYRDIYITELTNKINKFPCTYELYQKDADVLLVNVKLPSGNEFKNEYIDIRFSEPKPGLNIIRTDKGDEFSWENNVLRATISNDSSAIVGRPNSKTGVCDELIMHYHGQVCSNVRMTK